MTEKETEAAFVRFLLAEGWDVSTNNADHSDVIARRGAELLIAEVKGHTSEPGLDTTPCTGRCSGAWPRRCATPSTRWWSRIVGAEGVEGRQALRDKFAIEVYLVDETGAVREPS